MIVVLCTSEGYPKPLLMAGLACAVCNTRSAMKHSGRACTAMAVPASTKVLTALMLPAHMRVQLPFAMHIFIPTLHISAFAL